MLAFIAGGIVGFFLATLLWGVLAMSSKASRQEERYEAAQKNYEENHPCEP